MESDDEILPGDVVSFAYSPRSTRGPSSNSMDDITRGARQALETRFHPRVDLVI